ncbi:unnamed protein product [Dictyota dichotoma]
MIFWHNLFRYPRFFISSLIGLILIILNPFITILKQTKKKGSSAFFIVLIIAIFLFVLATLIIILQQMFLSE